MNMQQTPNPEKRENNVMEGKVHRRKGRTLLIVYVELSKNKLGCLRDKKYVLTVFYLAQSSNKQIICFDLEKQNTVKLANNDHPRDPKIVVIIDRWSLFRGSFML